MLCLSCCYYTSDPALRSTKFCHICLSLFEIIPHEFDLLIMFPLRSGNTRSDELLGILFRSVPGEILLVTVEGDTPRLPDGKPVAVLCFVVPSVAVAVADLSVFHVCIIPDSGEKARTNWGKISVVSVCGIWT